MPSLRLATCLTLSDPDPDAAPLEEALRAAGIDARWLAWEDPAADWATPAPTLLRSTWNYLHHHEAFVAWAARISAAAPLWNPAAVVRWNSHKGYLAELAAAGVPVVPTLHVRRGTPLPDAFLWSDVVVKPAVSAGSFGTRRFGAGESAAALAFLAEMSATRDMMVQPYLASVEAHGERSLIWIDGAFTHAIRKGARFHGSEEAITGPFPIEPDERAAADKALAAVPGGSKLLYARCDLARDGEGRPQLMELELIEPSLFFAQGPEALARLVAALRRRL
jgi:hypothetical protein